ncbi:MAG: anti-sigma factor domain-containing protein [Phycisphaerales bacterium]
MSPVVEDYPDRRAELLADRATQGLPLDEERELARLLGGAEDDSYERAAAAIDRALFAANDQPAPPQLVDKLRADALAFFDSPRRFEANDPDAKSNADSDTDSPAPISFAEKTAGTRESTTRRWTPWLVAAAAIAVAAVSWWGPNRAGESPAEQRAALIDDAGDAIIVPWGADDGLSGDVVWSPSRQAGYMRFRGLASNDPTVEQYQLWIFDAERDDRFPVDGGVFDIPANDGEVVVPIDPRLPVEKVALFAVTIEQPGGVVVSSRERIAALAPVLSDT